MNRFPLLEVGIQPYWVEFLKVVVDSTWCVNAGGTISKEFELVDRVGIGCSKIKKVDSGNRRAVAAHCSVDTASDGLMVVVFILIELEINIYFASITIVELVLVLVFNGQQYG